MNRDKELALGRVESHAISSLSRFRQYWAIRGIKDYRGNYMNRMMAQHALRELRISKYLYDVLHLNWSDLKN